MRQDRTSEGKRARQDAWLALVRKGRTEEEACQELGIGLHTPHKWRYTQGTPGEQARFRASVKEARASGKKRRVEGVPEFLTFREDHFAYMDRRRGKHPETGQFWVVRAANSWYQRDSQEKLEASRRLMVVLPPGHIKTTMWSIERSVHDIMLDRNFRIMAVQKNQGEAKKLISAVQERLDHPYYHNLAELLERQGDEPIECPLCKFFADDPFKPESRKAGSGEKWGSEAFEVLGTTSGEKDFTMQAFGVGSQIQGVRADRVVLDDVQDPSLAMRSPADSLSKLDWVQAVILGRVYDYQQVVVLANYFAPDDFAHKLIESQEGGEFQVVEYPAILNEGSKDVLCPETWTYDALLKKRKEVGESVWFYTWMQEAGSFEDMTFKREVLEDSRDESFVIGTIPYDVSDIFIGVDPAISTAGYCAIVVWGLNRATKQRYLIDVFNKSGMRNWDTVIDAILALARPCAGRLRTIAVEMNAQQGSLANHDRLRREARSLGARIVTYQTKTGTGARSEQDNYDITTLGALFDGGLITLPHGGTYDDLRKTDDYIGQLCQWRTDDQGRSIKTLVRDMVMATLFAESEAFPMANRPERPPSRGRRGKWAAGAWHRFDGQGGKRTAELQTMP